jgi:hypothetical protein
VSSGGVSGRSGAFAVFGPLDHIDVSTPSSVARDADFTVTATARDAAGNLLTGYAGSATWSHENPYDLTPSAPSDFVAGVSRTTASIYIPHHQDVLTVASGVASGQSRPFNVVGEVTDLTVQGPTSVKVGTPFTLTVTARDLAGNVLTDYHGDGTWYYAGSAGPLSPFSKGVSKTSATVSLPSRPDSLFVNTGPAFGFLLGFTSIGPVADLSVEWAPSTLSDDGCTGTYVARAIDDAGNVVTYYNDAHPRWTMDPGTTIAPVAPAPFVHGISTNPNIAITGGDGYGKFEITTGQWAGLPQACRY